MSASRSYLDYNATAPLRPEAREAMLAAMEHVGNPSSIHAEGRQARGIVETARKSVAALVGCAADRVVFTSGATEAAATALSPTLFHPRLASRAVRLLASAVEHTCVLRGHRFEAADMVPVDANGLVDLDRLGSMLAIGGPAVVAIQAANNETGVLQPVGQIAALVQRAGSVLVCDAAQAAGKIPLDAVAQADVILLSGHKMGGPAGIGAYVLGQGVSLADPLIRGGGQERAARSGTENVVGVAGFGAAAAQPIVHEADRSRALRDRFEAGLRDLCPDVVIFGRSVDRLPNTSCFALPGLAAETTLMALDIAGVAVSSGSACSSGKVGRSHVLEAMGTDPNIGRGALRVSLGWGTVEADLVRCLETIRGIMRRAQSRSHAAAA